MTAKLANNDYRLDKGGNVAKKGKKRGKGRIEVCDISEMGFKEIQFTEEESKAMQLLVDKIAKDSEEFFKNLKEFNGSEGN